MLLLSVSMKIVVAFLHGLLLSGFSGAGMVFFNLNHRFLISLFVFLLIPLISKQGSFLFSSLIILSLSFSF